MAKVIRRNPSQKFRVTARRSLIEPLRILIKGATVIGGDRVALRVLDRHLGRSDLDLFDFDQEACGLCYCGARPTQIGVAPW